MGEQTNAGKGSAGTAAVLPASPSNRAARYQAITEKLIQGVELGADALVEAVRQGAIKGRDLAIVVGIMVDKIAALEAKTEPPPGSVADLEKKLAELNAVQEELRRRKALATASGTASGSVH